MKRQMSLEERVMAAMMNLPSHQMLLRARKNKRRLMKGSPVKVTILEVMMTPGQAHQKGMSLSIHLWMKAKPQTQPVQMVQTIPNQRVRELHLGRTIYLIKTDLLLLPGPRAS
jgi:hypothetical protein